jgi:hypothetical protein
VFSRRCGIGRLKSAEVLHINTDPVLVVAPGEELAKLNFKPGPPALEKTADCCR